MPDNYRILEHPADLEVRVWGATKKELFANSMAVLAECLRPEPKEFPVKERLRVLSEGLEALLVDFLNEINYVSEVKRGVFTKVRFEKFSDTEIVADIYGNKVTRFGLQIKAVTFHQVEIKRDEQNRWQAHLLFDI